MKAQFLYLTIVLIAPSIATVLQQGPVDVASDPGQWVQFTCSVACSHSIDWYVESYVQDITTSCSDTADGMMVCKEVTQPCTSSTSTGYHTERLRVLAKPEIAGTNLTVQCAAISRSAPTASDCPPFLSYSRYALLSVRESSEPTVPTPTTPSPVICPSATQTTQPPFSPVPEAILADIARRQLVWIPQELREGRARTVGLFFSLRETALLAGVSIVTETVTVTQVSTVTQTLTVTITSPQPTVVPDPPAISRSLTPHSHLGRLLAELLSWGMTVLAGILVL